MKVVAGVDVGKRSLDVSVSGASPRRFDNNQKEIARLLAWLRSCSVTHLVYETTGGYERPLVRALRASEIKEHPVHPNRVRNFARIVGNQAKTDRLDAQMLSRYGETFELSNIMSLNTEEEELRDLLSRRRQLVQERTREKNRLDKGVSKDARSSIQRHIKWIDNEIQRLDKECHKRLHQCQSLTRKTDLYQSVPGVGQHTSAILAAYLPELGLYNGRQLSSLVGLAPWSKDSGARKGYRSIRGGRAKVRSALYMAALSAVRHNDDLKCFYQRLRRRGKSGKLALTAVMRKLLLLLSAVAHRGTPWVPNPSPTT